MFAVPRAIWLDARWCAASDSFQPEEFRWPGIGTYAFNAITGYEFAETIGAVIVFAVGVVLANLIADVLYGLLDPRVEWR